MVLASKFKIPNKTLQHLEDSYLVRPSPASEPGNKSPKSFPVVHVVVSQEEAFHILQFKYSLLTCNCSTILSASICFNHQFAWLTSCLLRASRQADWSAWDSWDQFFCVIWRLGSFSIPPRSKSAANSITDHFVLIYTDQRLISSGSLSCCPP